jgi:hypothetical protein
MDTLWIVDSAHKRARMAVSSTEEEGELMSLREHMSSLFLTSEFHDVSFVIRASSMNQVTQVSKSLKVSEGARRSLRRELAQPAAAAEALASGSGTSSSSISVISISIAASESCALLATLQSLLQFLLG